MSAAQEISPFFIIGNPRSGTSLLRLMLNNHPLISVPPECGFVVWLHEKYKEESFLDKNVVENFITDVMKSRKFETWGVDRETIESFVLSRSFQQYKEIASAIYFAFALKIGKSPALIGDKNNYYIKHIETLKEIFNSPKFIFIVRDGRDVACSYRELSLKNISSIYAPNIPSSLELMANEWAVNNSLILKELNEQSLFVSYEDLVSDTSQTLGRICSFLNVVFSESMLEYYEHNDEPLEFLQWKSKTLEKPDAGNVGKYKNILTHDEVMLFESLAGETLSAFGYNIRN